MIIISNAGTHPEPAHLAAGLANSDIPVNYLTTASWASDATLMKLVSGARIRETRPATQIQRRKLPHGLETKSVKTTALAMEAIFQVASRKNLGKKEDILYRRNRIHRQKVARAIQAAQPKAVVAQYHSAKEPFLAANDKTMKILMYPIAHHDWMQRTMSLEARRNPKWAGYLQGAILPETKKSLLDSEITMADAIIVPSTFVKETFTASGIPDDKLTVLNLGADIPESTRTQTGRSTQEPATYLFAGQVNQRKGISYVLDAFKMVDRAGTKLLIAGPAIPEMRRRLEEYENVEYLGTMPRESLSNVMAKSDAIFLPSFAEGFPLTAIEAMAAGCVPVLSEYTFASDVITHGENGYIIDAGSTNQIVECMREIADNPQKTRAMARKARDTAKRFSWQRYEANAAQIIPALVREWRNDRY